MYIVENKNANIQMCLGNFNQENIIMFHAKPTTITDDSDPLGFITLTLTRLDRFKLDEKGVLDLSNLIACKNDTGYELYSYEIEYDGIGPSPIELDNLISHLNKHLLANGVNKYFRLLKEEPKIMVKNEQCVASTRCLLNVLDELKVDEPTFKCQTFDSVYSLMSKFSIQLSTSGIKGYIEIKIDSTRPRYPINLFFNLYKDLCDKWLNIYYAI